MPRWGLLVEQNLGFGGQRRVWSAGVPSAMSPSASASTEARSARSMRRTSIRAPGSVLCDPISAQAAVLERNMSAEVAAEYKRAAIANVMELGASSGSAYPRWTATARAASPWERCW